MEHHDIIVVGSGVSGLTTALSLSRAGFDIGVVTKDPLNQTTSAIAAAFWLPYLCEPVHRAIKWSRDTYSALSACATDQESGVFSMPLDTWFPSSTTPPWWASAAPHCDPIADRFLLADFHAGYSTTSWVMDTTRYLPWLQKQLAQNGVHIVEEHIGSINELAVLGDIVINCAGLGARELCGDTSLIPIRGQVISVASFGATRISVSEETTTHITPRLHDTIIGGTAYKGRSDTAPDANDTRSILGRAAIFLPADAAIDILDINVGIRPSRPTVRLELDLSYLRPVIHNYGHGGAGYTLSWGCAQDVVDLVYTLTT